MPPGQLEWDGGRTRQDGSDGLQHTARPTLGIDEIEGLAQHVPERCKGTVYLFAWAGIRLGEAAALRCEDVDVKHSQIRVERAAYPIGGEYQVQTPKSRGIQPLHLPAE